MLKDFLCKYSFSFVENESLKKHTTMKVGGNADFIVYPKNAEEVSMLISFLNKENIRYYILGNGSNVMFSDEGFKGVIIKSEKLNDIKKDGNKIYFGAGVSMTKAAKTAVENSLSGIEYCYGIPGNIGGGLYMNAGAYGGEISSSLVSVDCVDENGEIKTISAKDCDYGYRHSVFMSRRLFILGGLFQFEYGNKAELKRFCEEIMQKRISKQPLDMPSAGSSFKRPSGYFAAALIDECGLKGKTIGGAQVSEKHAGFIVNKGDATCKDITALADYVENEVYKKTGIKIEKEMIIVE
ncbi:MAG: UDP-N-acetylmuramate dehydrogenase [Oscillospiraceae bacterium]|nr:UDP-N-acetylmuramate dehydrogenase [Oscillospiraceae bacterium]